MSVKPKKIGHASYGYYFDSMLEVTIIDGCYYIFAEGECVGFTKDRDVALELCISVTDDLKSTKKDLQEVIQMAIDSVKEVKAYVL